MNLVKPYPIIKWLIIATIAFQHETDAIRCESSEVQSNSVASNGTKYLTCKGRCSRGVQWDDGKDVDRQPHCHCDPSCTMYKDCCRDYPTFCGNQTVRSSSDPEFSCRLVSNKERVWMMESCPHLFKDKTVRDKCSSTQKYRAETIMDQLAVYNPFTNLHYKNVYCAKCNSAGLILFYYDLLIKCDLSPPKKGLNYTETLNYMFEHCLPENIQMQLPKDVKRRFCFPTEDSCPRGASTEARKLCLRSPPAVVYNPNTKKNYLNMQCMACHPGVSVHDAKCGPLPGIDKIFNPKSFEFVMKFDSLSGSTEKKVSTTCKPGWVYDRHLEICRQDTVPGPSRAASDKYRIKMWLSPVDGKKLEIVSHQEFIKALTIQINPLDPEQVDVVSLKKEDRSMTVLFDLHAKYHNVGAKSNKSNGALDLKALLDFQDSFTMVVTKRKWKVFKVTTRRLSCTKSEVYLNYTILAHTNQAKIESNGKTEYFSQKQYYILRRDDHPFNKSTLVICRSFFGVLCNHSMLAAVESEYTIFQNKSLLFKPTGQWFKEEEYDMRGKTPWICTNYKFKKYSPSNTSNTTEIITRKPSIHVEIRRYMTIIGFSISVISLFLVLLTHGILRDLRTPLPGKNLMSLSLSLFLAHFWYLLGSGDTDKPLFCKITAHILHYLFLASFGCTLIVAYDTRRTFSVKTAKAHAVGGSFQTKRLAMYLLISWGIPFVFVIICATLDWLNVVTIGYGKGEACWIGNSTALLVLFAAPIGLVLVYNVVAFSQTVYAISKARKQAQRIKSGNHYTRPETVKIYMRLVSLMGFSWFFAFSAPFIHNGLMYPFVFFTTLQGLYIFLAFVFKAKVLRMIKAKLPLRKHKHVRRPTKGTVSTVADSTPYNKYTSSLKDVTQI